MSLSITQFQGTAMVATVEQGDRALLLETHICIARSAYCPSPAVKSLLKQRLHKKSNHVGVVVSLPG